MCKPVLRLRYCTCNHLLEFKGLNNVDKPPKLLTGSSVSLVHHKDKMVLFMTVPSVPSSSEAQNGFPSLSTSGHSKAEALSPFPMNSALPFQRKTEAMCLSKTPHSERE